jgi:hypothetical protein
LPFRKLKSWMLYNYGRIKIQQNTLRCNTTNAMRICFINLWKSLYYIFILTCGILLIIFKHFLRSNKKERYLYMLIGSECSAESSHDYFLIDREWCLNRNVRIARDCLQFDDSRLAAFHSGNRTHPGAFTCIKTLAIERNIKLREQTS